MVINDADNLVSRDGGVHLGGLLVIDEADLGVGVFPEKVLDRPRSFDIPVFQGVLRLAVDL